MRCYHRYMSFAVQQPPTYKQFVANMEEKMVDPDFLGDTQLLLRPDEPFDPIEGYKAVKERLIETCNSNSMERRMFIQKHPPTY